MGVELGKWGLILGWAVSHKTFNLISLFVCITVNVVAISCPIRLRIVLSCSRIDFRRVESSLKELL